MELPGEYLNGIDLFNERRYFDSHEALEALWLKSTGERREFLHALIQIAAALHHLEQGNPRGAASIYRRARKRLDPIPVFFMRLEIAPFLAEVDRFFLASTNAESTVPCAPQIQLRD